MVSERLRTKRPLGIRKKIHRRLCGGGGGPVSAKGTREGGVDPKTQRGQNLGSIEGVRSSIENPEIVLVWRGVRNLHV